MVSDQRLIPLAALQHYAYCPRQCALIHNEQVWADNWFTAQGNVLHQRVDNGDPETRRGVRFERGVLINAPRLGLIGKMDLLEIEASQARYTPVEYKRGKAKVESWDRVQVCAQALCLEEMLDINIDEAALWYWQTRHREPVICDSSLREETRAVIQSVKALFDQESLPTSVAEKKRCKACSLEELCQPELIRNDHTLTYCETLFAK
ncbi:CRISPR-associated protein Cas4 [bacterium AH-315-K03]|nr:CRISPR-associated protein Cas4 [bacterium AH-315-K03]